MYVDRDKVIWWFIEHFNGEDLCQMSDIELFRYIDSHLDIPTYARASRYNSDFEESIANGWIYG